MTQDRFHSPSRSAASISPLGDQISDVTTRADDRWARLTLLLWSQREEDWRERVKSDQMVGTIEPSTCSHPTSARHKGANQKARWKTARNVSKDSRRRSVIAGRRRRFYARKLWRRMKWPEGWRNWKHHTSNAAGIRCKTFEKMATGKSWMNCYSMTTENCVRS